MRAAGRLARFDFELNHLHTCAAATATTARSLRVLQTVLTASGRPETTIGELELHPEAFHEHATADAVESVASLLAQYRVCAPADRAGLAGTLKTAVNAAAPDAALAADAYANALREMEGAGRKQAMVDADALETGASASKR